MGHRSRRGDRERRRNPAQGRLPGIARALQLSHATITNIRQNLFFAFIYNAAGVPVTAGILYTAFGLLLSPIIAAAMALSSVSVIANSLRLRGCAYRRRGPRQKLGGTVPSGTLPPSSQAAIFRQLSAQRHCGDLVRFHCRRCQAGILLQRRSPTLSFPEQTELTPGEPPTSALSSGPYQAGSLEPRRSFSKASCGSDSFPPEYRSWVSSNYPSYGSRQSG